MFTFKTGALTIPIVAPLARFVGHTTHADLMGPFNPIFRNGYRFILIMVDGYSRYITKAQN